MTPGRPDTSVREWATFAYRTWTGVPAPYPRIEMPADGRIELLGVRVREGAPVAGKTRAELGEELKRFQYTTVAIVRGGTRAGVADVTAAVEIDAD